MDVNTLGVLSQANAADYPGPHNGTEPRGDEHCSWERPELRGFFRSVADQIRRAADPASVLDVRCGPGLLVQALCEQGVDAYGIDESQHALDTAHPDVLPRLSVGPVDKLTGSWDLIVCIEGLDGMGPMDSELAIDAMTSASHRVLLSARPMDARAPTPNRSQDQADWSASFADREFFRRTDVDFSLLAPWAGLYERTALTRRALVVRYERYTSLLRLEVLERRAALLESCRQIGESGAIQRQVTQTAELETLKKTVDETRAANLELRHRLLTSRDHAIGAEAEAARSAAERDQARAETARLLAELDQARAEAARAHDHVRELHDSTTWRLGSAVVRPTFRVLRRRP